MLWVKANQFFKAFHIQYLYLIFCVWIQYFAYGALTSKSHKIRSESLTHFILMTRELIYKYTLKATA